MAKERNTEKFGLRLPPTLLAKIKRDADAEGRSEADVVRRVLDEHYEARSKAGTL